MKTLIHSLIIAVIVCCVGCSKQAPRPADSIEFSPSEGTSYLDAARDVITSEGWSLISESGTRAQNGPNEEVTITGQAADGKQVFFTARFTSDSRRAYLVVKTEDGFPVPPAKVIELVKSRHNK